MGPLPLADPRLHRRRGTRAPRAARAGGAASLATLAAATLLHATPASAAPSPTPSRPATVPSVTFGTVGDHGTGPRTAAVLRRIGRSGAAFFLSLGDLSYGTRTPHGWCGYVKANLNAGAGRLPGAPYGTRVPFLLTEGNHDHGSYGSYARRPACHRGSARWPPRSAATAGSTTWTSRPGRRSPG